MSLEREVDCEGFIWKYMFVCKCFLRISVYSSGDDMAKTNKKPKGGFSLFKNKKGAMPKQPKGAKTIKVKV